MAPVDKKSELKFARGFKRLDNHQIKDAMIAKNKRAIKAGANLNQKTLESLLNHFKPIPDPSDELDWLVQFREPRQTVDQFFQNTPIRIEEKVIGNEQFIYYVKMGDFTESQLNFESLMEYSRCFFNDKAIKVLPGVITVCVDKEAAKSAAPRQTASIEYGGKSSKVKLRIDPTSGRWQIVAQSVHGFLKKIKPNDSVGLIAFTDYDLFCDESDLFVAGLCDGYLRVAIFSCFRYNPSLTFSQEDWFDVRVNAKKVSKRQRQVNQETHLNRSCKLLVHETCHVLGIEHCIYLDCCMNGSGHIEEDYRQSMFLCPVDLNKLSMVMSIDIGERYRKLKALFDKQVSARAESEWLQKAIESIESK